MNLWRFPISDVSKFDWLSGSSQLEINTEGIIQACYDW